MRARSVALWRAHSATGSGASTRQARKIASQSAAVASLSGRSGNTCRAQPGVAAGTRFQLIAKPVMSSSAGR